MRSQVYATYLSSSVFSSIPSHNILPSSQSCFHLQTLLLNSTQHIAVRPREAYERIKLLNVFAATSGVAASRREDSMMMRLKNHPVMQFSV